jgi:predicted  nucleic acid-binding Zn-ribbon protein
MRTEEERLTALEELTREYRPVLQNFSYELTMVKGLIVTQTEITQELSRDMRDVKLQSIRIERHLETMDKRIETLERDMSALKTMVAQILERLPKP